MSETKPTELTVRAKTTGEIAVHLRALADQFDALGDQPIELTWINVGMQVQRPLEGEQRNAERHATVDLLASAFNCEPTTGKDGWRNADVYFGLTIYASVEKPAEPVKCDCSVPLAAVSADADTVKAETLADWSQYDGCFICEAAPGAVCRNLLDNSLRRRPHRNRSMVARPSTPLVEVQPDAEAVRDER